MRVRRTQAVACPATLIKIAGPIRSRRGLDFPTIGPSTCVGLAAGSNFRIAIPASQNSLPPGTPRRTTTHCPQTERLESDDGNGPPLADSAARICVDAPDARSPGSTRPANLIPHHRSDATRVGGGFKNSHNQSEGPNQLAQIPQRWPWLASDN
jgi:hypothetical protein